jgi:hypothetical protein
MNEQLIAELAYATLLRTGAPTGSREWQKIFAELIVRMCADAADMAQDAGCEYAGDYVAEYMGYGQEHGVTEWRAK